MQLKIIAVNLFTVTVSFAITGIVIAGVIIPYFIAKQLTVDTRQVAMSLEKDFAALENTTYLSIIDEPSVATNQKQRDIQFIQRQIETTLQEITALERTANRVNTWQFPDLANVYNDAQIVSAKSRSIASQTRVVVQEYKDIISYLEFYNSTIDEVRVQNDRFNAITDFNEYAGQGDTFRAVAATFRRHIAALDATTPPRELETSTSRLRVLLDTAAAGYESLAAGLDAAIDKNIYDAVMVIELAAREFESSTGEAYITSLENSRIIKDIRQLEQKLDPLTSTN